jgi:hypothetical protein
MSRRQLLEEAWVLEGTRVLEEGWVWVRRQVLWMPSVSAQ